jgi:hypothetical protein
MRNTPAEQGEGVKCQLGSDSAPYTRNPADAQTAVEPCILIERVVAYRVSVSPRNATEPYASGEPEIFTTHMAAAAFAKDAAEGWSFALSDLSGGPHQ